VFQFGGLAYKGKDIMFRFNGFWPLGNNRSIFTPGFLKDDILASIET
jgi:hypothetical protein